MAERIVWLASYPKSGNTWMRILLTNYLRNAEQPADINDLEGGPIASARVWFDEYAGLQASLLEDAVVERLRPAVYRHLAADASERLFMKAHDAWSRTDRGEPLFPPEVTAGVVYIVRNPLDVAASYAHHYGVDLEQAVRALCDPQMALARSLGGLADQLRQRLGSWSGHVQSWVDASGLPVHVVRYEDLHADTVAVLGEIIRYCGMDDDPLRLRKAVRQSAFDELRGQEREKGFRERSIVSPGPFFRQGRTGGWKHELSPALVDALIEAHGAVMRRFGYLNAVGEPDECR